MTATMAMFAGLVPPPRSQSFAFLQLQEKLGDLRPPRIHHVSPKLTLQRVLVLERTIEKHLFWREIDPPSQRPDLENRIEDRLNEARRIVFALQLSQLRRRAAARRITTATLRWLYSPNGAIPVINRELFRLGVVGDGEFGLGLGSGDGDGDGDGDGSGE